MKKITLLIILSLLISAVSVSAEQIEKLSFIHYKNGKIKAVDSNAKPTETTCYKLLGVKWMATPVVYTINPTNSGLNASFVSSAISVSAEEWDSYTNTELFNDVYTIDYSATWDDSAPDYQNEYVFGNYAQQNVIAVTNIWGYFGGPKAHRKIIEYDVLFNTYYTWGDASVNPSVMDLQNIATHETGHGIGLGDLYNTCVSETMYGYSNNGDLSKRDLSIGDIAGLQKLYGK